MANNYFTRRCTIPTLDNCCCLSLKTGGIIIASIYLIPITLAAGFSGWEMITTAISRGHIREDDSFANLTEEIERIEGWHDAYIAQFAMVNSAILVLLATGILHIYGSIREKRVFMLPFMTVSGFIVIVTVCSEIVRILFWTSSVIGFFVSVLLGGVEVYSMLVLLNFYRQLQAKSSANKEDDTDDVIEAIEGAL